jgi:membrane protease YdiL (CAAX protease family)
MLTREAIIWGFALAILLWLTSVEHLPLSSIGFRRPTWKSVLFGFLAAIVITVIMTLQFAVVIPLLHLSASAAVAQQQAILKTPFWYRILTLLRAAVVEEIIFRGYLIEKIRQVSGSTGLAVAVSVLAFTCAHLRGWGPVHLIPVAAFGLVLALLYVWRRDLPSNILAHFLSDAVGFLAR